MDNRKIGFKFVIYDVNHETLAKHMDGSKSLISGCRARGVRHAIISELSRPELTARLNEMGMFDLFERQGAWARQRTVMLKMTMVHFDAHKTTAAVCYIGDSPEGLEVAKKFGMTTIAFAEDPGAADSLTAISAVSPDHVVHSFEDIFPIFNIQ